MGCGEGLGFWDSARRLWDLGVGFGIRVGFRILGSKP